MDKENVLENGRLAYIDALKGIAIFMVILGHSYISERMQMYIFSFHMPLFFFISGILFKPRKNISDFDFIKLKFKKLLIPYIIFSLISILIIILFDSSNIYNIYIYIQEIFLAKRNHHSFNIALWFLPTLFFVEILYFLLQKYIKDDSIISLILIISSYIGVINFQALASVNTLPFTIDVGIVYILFYHIGYMFKDIDNNALQYKITSIICIILSVIIFVDKGYFDCVIIPITGDPYFNISIYLREMIVAMISILAYLYISRLIEKNNIIRYIGKNSMYLFALHMPLTLPLARYIFEKLNVIFKIVSLNGVVITLLTILLTIIIVFIYNTTKSKLQNLKINRILEVEI